MATKYEHVVMLIEKALTREIEVHPTLVDCSVETLLTICNGCGPAGAKLDLVPDTIEGLTIKLECHTHDYDYAKGATEADRVFADKRLRRNLFKRVRGAKGFVNRLLVPTRSIRVLIIYRAVRLGGEKPFWANKENNVVTLGTY